MKYYRLAGSENQPFITVETSEGVLESITSLRSDIRRIEDLISAASISGKDIDELSNDLLKTGRSEKFSLDQIIEQTLNKTTKPKLLKPLDPPEIWAAGVTYKNSELERIRESDTPDIYSKVYMAERPEIFFKSTSARCSGPYDKVGIRSDSNWNVPEAELTFITYNNEIVGYTAGNDMSSRSIEGENPLYLPQAKIYSHSCSIGPCFASTQSISNPQNLEVTCTIVREHSPIFSQTTSTSDMARSCQDIATWLYKCNSVPDFTAVMTGTSIVPPPEFTLRKDDTIRIDIESIGALVNSVVEV